jgi:triosephosphate isomerase
MRPKIVAGNWKMNLTFEKADQLLFEIGELIEEKKTKGVEIIICPPSPYLELATDFAQDFEIKVGAQNVSQYEDGAYTGEISAAMLSSIDIDFSIVGHSERRKYFAETNASLAAKVDRLLEYGIQPIFCIGEQLEERESNKHFEVVKSQLVEGIFHLSQSEFSNIVIAYEPVWAIGTGKTASPEQAQEMHAFIRQLIIDQYGEEQAHETSILYGGSCNAKNAKELFAQADVDGGLIGGASLKAEEFMAIANSF